MTTAVALTATATLGLAFVFAIGVLRRFGRRRLALPVAGMAMLFGYAVIKLSVAAGIVRPDGAEPAMAWLLLAVGSLAIPGVFIIGDLLLRQRELITALGDTEERFSRMAGGLAVGIFEADTRGHCTYANQQACRISGLSSGDTLGSCWVRTLHEADRDRVINDWHQAHIENRDFRAEYRLMRPDGTARWVIGQISRVCGPDGQPVGYVGAITDITDRKRAEAALHQAQSQLEQRVAERTASLLEANRDLKKEISSRRKAETAVVESEQRLRAIVDNTPAYIYIKDPYGRYLFASRSLAAALEMPAEEIQGRTDHDLFPQSVADMAVANDRRVWAEGKAMEFDEKSYDLFGQEHTFLATKFPLQGANGNIRAICGVSTDITERTRVDSECKRIFDLSLDMMCSVSFEGHFKMVNPELLKTLGYSDQDLLFHPIYELIHADDIETSTAAGKRMMEGHPMVGFENRFRCKDGSYRLLSWNATPSANNTAVYAVARDITDIRRLEQASRRRRDEMAHMLRLQTMGEIASEIAHELNQPLSAVVNYARGGLVRIGSIGLSDEEVRELLEKISEQGLRAGDLIRRIRRFARKADPGVESLDINQLVRNAVGLLEASESNCIAIEFTLATSLPPVEADGVQIEQVILNLLLNAVEASNGDTPVEALRIRTRLVDDAVVELEVDDAGAGIRKGSEEKVFEPFYTTKPEGLGMGLPISRSIAEAHGGSLTASPNSRTGTTFRLVLPAAA